MSLPDITSLNDTDFAALAASVYAESQRREALKAIPTEISALAQRYRDGGGDDSVLAAAVAPQPEDPDELLPEWFRRE